MSLVLVIAYKRHRGHKGRKGRTSVMGGKYTKDHLPQAIAGQKTKLDPNPDWDTGMFFSGSISFHCF